MVPFLLAAVASDGSVTFDSNAPASTDFWIGPQRYGAAKVFGTEDAVAGTDTRANGLRYTSEGVLRVYDATSAVPAGATTIGGFAVTSDGQLCVSTDAVSSATFVGGIAVRSDGAVFATGLSTPRSIADAIITALTPAAWYRNATDVVSSGGFASIWADYASSNKGLALPGVSGNYASTPDSAAVSVTGDIDIQIRLSAADWTPAVLVPLVAKRINAGQYGYDFYVASTGALIFRYSPDGTASRTATSSAVNTLTDGDISWLRATYNSTTGKVNFYIGGSAATPSWSALGVEQTLTAGSIFDGTDPLYIGTNVGVYLSGVVYRAIVKNGIDGTTVFDADFSSQAIGAASFTESSSNAATVTINASGAAPAHIGKARDLLQGTGTNQPAYAGGILSLDGADNFMATADFAFAQPLTLFFVMYQDTWTAGDIVFDGDSNLQMFAQAVASPNLQAFAGTSVLNTNPDLALQTWGIIAIVFNGASSSIRLNNNAKVTANAGANNPTRITIGKNGGVAASYFDGSFKEIVAFDSALSDANQDAVITALNNALTVF